MLSLLLQRHDHKNKKTNEAIAKQDNDTRVEAYGLLTDQGEDSELTKAAKVLTVNGFQLFKQVIAESQHYSYSVMSDGSYAVYRNEYPDSPRFFQTKESLCDCNDRVANLKQCVHQWCLHPKFIPNQWSQYYLHHSSSLSFQNFETRKLN